jgi:hypothetical protein
MIISSGSINQEGQSLGFLPGGLRDRRAGGRQKMLSVRLQLGSCFFAPFSGGYVGRMASETRLRTSPLYFRAGFTEFLIKSAPLMRSLSLSTSSRLFCDQHALALAHTRRSPTTMSPRCKLAGTKTPLRRKIFVRRFRTIKALSLSHLARIFSTALA